MIGDVKLTSKALVPAMSREIREALLLVACGILATMAFGQWIALHNTVEYHCSQGRYPNKHVCKLIDQVEEEAVWNNPFHPREFR
jgi:hypothetical protein